MSEKNAQPGPGRGDRLYRLSQAGRRINESLDVDREGGIKSGGASGSRTPREWHPSGGGRATPPRCSAASSLRCTPRSHQPDYEAGLTVTSKESLTSLPSGSSAVTVMVAVPVDVATTVRVEPDTHIDATP